MKLLLDVRLPSFLTFASGSRLADCCLRGIKEMADFRLAILKASPCESCRELSSVEAACDGGSVANSGVVSGGDEVVVVDGESAIRKSSRFSLSILQISTGDAMCSVPFSVDMLEFSGCISSALSPRSIVVAFSVSSSINAKVDAVGVGVAVNKTSSPTAAAASSSTCSSSAPSSLSDKSSLSSSSMCCIASVGISVALTNTIASREVSFKSVSPCFSTGCKGLYNK